MASLSAPEIADPVADAQSIRIACQGWGSDEKGIIELIGHRNWSQLKLIKESYFQQFNEDLIKRLERELHGDFERAVCRWILEPHDREAVLAYEALAKHDFKVIIELACTLSSDELLATKRAYQVRYRHSLEEDVASYTNDNVRKLLLLLVGTYRHETNQTDARLAEAEAQIIHKAIKDEQFDSDEILRIVGTRSKSQLVATFFRYKEAYGDSITKDLLENSNNDKYVVLLESAIECLDSPQGYLESVLRDALLKGGTDKDALTRVILTRAERDLKEIMELYHTRNSVNLEQSVDKETHGHYKRFLISLLGGQYH